MSNALKILSILLILAYSCKSRADSSCPEGSSILESHKLCISGDEAVGPFTQAMIDKCIKHGGGNVPCYSDRWSKNYAMAIRGTDECMPGSSYNDRIKECTSFGSAYGPFSKETINKCLDNGGGELCHSMKIKTSLIWSIKYDGSMPYILISRTGEIAYEGLELLTLELLDNRNRRLGAVDAVSGQSWAQNFRTAPDSRTGSYEPLPEGVWMVDSQEAGHNGLEWAGGLGDYSTYWNAGLGPVWLSIVPKPGYETERAAIGIHLDANRSDNPGTAGCVGISSLGQLKTFVSWFSSRESSPITIVVDWGLGTIPEEIKQ